MTSTFTRERGNGADSDVVRDIPGGESSIGALCSSETKSISSVLTLGRIVAPGHT